MASGWVEEQTKPYLTANALKAEAVLGISAAMKGGKASEWKTPEKKIDLHVGPGYFSDTEESVAISTPLNEFQKVFDKEEMNNQPDHLEYACNVCLDPSVQVRYSVEEGNVIPGYTALIGGKVAPSFWKYPIPMRIEYLMSCTVPVFTKK